MQQEQASVLIDYFHESHIYEKSDADSGEMANIQFQAPITQNSYTSAELQLDYLAIYGAL